MNILVMMIPISLTLGILFLLFFLSAVSNDQFQDFDTNALLPLSDDETNDLNLKKIEGETKSE